MDADRMRSTVWLVKYGENAVNYELIVWADRQLTTQPASTQAKLMWALDDALAKRGIEMQFPQRNLHVRSGTLDVRMVKDENASTNIDDIKTDDAKLLDERGAAFSSSVAAVTVTKATKAESQSAK